MYLLFKSRRNWTPHFSHCPVSCKICENFGITLDNNDIYKNIYRLCHSTALTTTWNNHLIHISVLTPITLWNISKTRNNKLFKHQPSNHVNRITHTILFQALELQHISYTSGENHPKKTRIPITWQKPPDDHFKLNIDGSFQPETFKCGTGCVIRNHSRQWITGFACKTKVDSAYHAVLLSLLHGLTLAKTKTIK